MLQLTYLAAPYSHKDPEVVEARVAHIAKAAARLLLDTGHNIFSPITHSHPLASLAEIPGDWEFWRKIDTDWLERCDDVVVLLLPGWRESVGVTAEIKIAKELGLPIRYMHVLMNGGHVLTDFAPEEEKSYALAQV
jgi:Domain of unknown function (DUF1937)